MKALILIGGFVVLVSLINSTGGGDSQSTNTSSSSSSSSSSQSQGSGDQGSRESTVKAGEVVTVADASWSVTNAHTISRLQDQLGLEPAKQGNFVVVDFDYTNNGNEPKTLTPSILALYDSSNRKSGADTDVIRYTPHDKNIFVDQVNPGVTKSGEVIFSVAPGGSGYRLELSNTNYFKADNAYVQLGI